MLYCSLFDWNTFDRALTSHVDGLVHECSLSSANALEILQSSTKSSL